MNRIFIFIFLGLVGFCKLNAQTEFNGQQQTNFSGNFELRESEPVMNIQEYNAEITGQLNQPDQLKSSTASPAATYKHPSGYLTSGFSRKNTLLNANNKLANVHMGNAYTATQWTSIKNADTQRVEWYFKNDLIETTDNPTVTLSDSIYENPVLSAINGNQVVQFQQGETGTYNRYKLGGENKWTINNESVEFGLGNYDPSILREFAEDMVPKNLNGDTIGFDNFKGIGNKFDKPVAPFLIRGVYIFCVNIVPKDNEPVLLNIYTMNANGTKGTLLATSTAERNSYVNIGSTEFGNSLSMIPFTFPAYIEISTDYFIEFLNYKSGSPLFQGTSNADGTNYAYLVFNDKIETVPSHYTDRNTGGRLNTAFCINLDASFPYIHSDSPAKQFSPAGGSNTFVMTGFTDMPDKWVLENKEQLNKDGNWIKLGNFVIGQTGINLPVTVDPLPNNISSRRFELKYKAQASSITLTIDQNKDYVGIESIQENQVKAFCQNDYFCLEYPADVYQTVSIYNIAGQQINECKLDATGAYMIPASNLPRGMYILKFGGTANQSVKIVKQ